MRLLKFLAAILGTMIVSLAHGQTTMPASPASQPAINPATTRPAVEVILSDGPAPCAIHIHALDTPLGAGTPNTARYEWDFGDPNGRFNTLVGFNAAHVYDQPGKYVLRLKIRNENGDEKSFRGSLTIPADLRKTIYVDQNAAGGGDGLSADRPVRTLAVAIASLADDTKILLRRGQTFDLAKTISIQQANVLIGAYGDGERPVLAPMFTKGSILSLTAKARDVVIENLTFDVPGASTGEGKLRDVVSTTTQSSSDTPVAGRPDALDPTKNPVTQRPAWGKAPKLGIVAVQARGTNIVVRGCQFLNLDDAINAQGKPSGLLIADNIAPLITGLRGYFVWLQNPDTVIVGNTIANSTREHIVRSSSQETQRLLIAQNDFSNPSRADDKDDMAKTTVNLRACRFAYITGNKLAGGPVAMGPSADEPVDYLAQWIVVEGNRFNKNSLQIYPNTRHLFVRNNVFTKENSEQILVLPSEKDRPGGTIGVGARVVADLQFANNTGINNSKAGKFMKVDGVAPPGEIALINNLYVAPNLTPGGNYAAGLEVLAADVSAFREIRGNVWPLNGKIGVNYVWPGLNPAAGYLTNDRWLALSAVKDDRFAKIVLDDRLAPSADSPAIGTSIAAGVYDDLTGAMRPEGACTAGAVEAKQ